MKIVREISTNYVLTELDVKRAVAHYIKLEHHVEIDEREIEFKMKDTFGTLEFSGATAVLRQVEDDSK